MSMGGFGSHGPAPDKAGPNVIGFHPLNAGELARWAPLTATHVHQAGSAIHQLQLGPKHRNYSCGACGLTTNGRVLCEVDRTDGSTVLWCWCSCEKREPCVVIEKGGKVISQLPIAKEFHSEPDWPPELARLYDEAAKSFAAGAFTATAMVCRKILMACACKKGEPNVKDGEPFTFYVDYITTNVLKYADAKSAIDAIRTIGNDATHDTTMVNQVDAFRAMKIVTYMLNTIYSLPKM